MSSLPNHAQTSDGQVCTSLRGWQSLEALQAQWTTLLETCTSGVVGPDVTCSYTWAEALSRTHLRDAEWWTAVVTRGSEISAILPTYVVEERRSGLRSRELRLITESHGGRTGLLVKGNDESLAHLALDAVLHDAPRWDVLALSVVDGAASHVSLATWLDRHRLAFAVGPKRVSPLVELPGEWTAMLAALPKKFRWTINKGEKDLRARGRLEYRHVTDPVETTRLMSDICSIERRSWKEAAGSSITRNAYQLEFYESMVELAARDRILSAHLLSLDDEPIGYCLGVKSPGGVFLYLKGSYDEAFSDCSAGHVIDRFTFEELIAQGYRTVDFMGRCDPYKMRWTDRTYARVRYTVFNRSLAGRIRQLRSRLGRLRAEED